MTTIPRDLLEVLDSVLLFVGEGINQGALPSSAELAQELAALCDLPPDEPLTLPRAAGYYDAKRNDRNGLIRFLRERLDDPDLEPLRTHRLIAQLQPHVIVTTCYDRLLERALKDAHIPYAGVVRNEEIAYTKESEVLLVWLWGVLDQPDSLVVTEDDHRLFMEPRANLSDVLRGEMAKRHWLFVGFDAKDEWLRDFYDRVTRALDPHRRRAFIYGGDPGAYARAWWEKRNAGIFGVDVEQFLEALVNQRAARPYPGESTIFPGVAPPLPEIPYKALLPYEATDRGRFFGREREIQKLTARIHAERLVLLCGASGVGKTSLLQAGVIPWLEGAEPRYKVISVRALTDDPAAQIRGTLRRQLSNAELPADDVSLVDFVNAFTRISGLPLVVVIDQIEEFFIHFSPASRAGFIAELGALYDARDVPVKVVLSIRDDWLASVHEIRERIPEIFDLQMRLGPLSREQAGQAIMEPARQVGMRYEDRLVDRLLDDLWLGGVMPPQLQIVCSALYDKREGRALIRLETYEQLGGTEGILRGYLDQKLKDFEPQMRVLARRLLEEMVTSKGTRVSKSLSELALALDIEAQELQSLVNQLIASRLVRPVEREDGQIAYEIVHEYLVQDLDISEEAKRRKRAEEWLRQDLDDWHASRRDLETQAGEVLIGSQRLSEIETQYTLGQLRVRDHDAFELLLLSALRSGKRIDYWVGPMLAPDVGMSRLATDCVASALLDPDHSSSALKAIQISRESLDVDWRKQLVQELGHRYMTGKASERERLVDPLWELRDHLPVSLWAKVAARQTLKQIALRARQVVAGLILASLLVGGILLHQWGQRGTWTQYDFNEVGIIPLIAVEPGNERVLWALVEGGRYGHALHRSEDGGDHWELALEETTRGLVTDMVVGLGDHNQPLVYIGAFGAGVYVFDTETGEIGLRNLGLVSYWIHNLVVDPEDRKTIYLGTGDNRGIYVSADFGKTWRQIGGDALSSASIVGMAAFANPRRIYVWTDEDRIWFGDGITSDWKLAVPEGCDPRRPEGIECDLRFTLYGRGRITDIATDRQNHLLYAATSAKLIGLLDDANQKWTARFIPGADLYDRIDHLALTGGDEPVLFASVWGTGGVSLYRSRNGGQAWEMIVAPELSHSGVFRLLSDPDSSDRLYVASDLGLVRTVDGGDNWTVMDLNFPPALVEVAYMGEGNDAPVYLTSRGVVYRGNVTGVGSFGWTRADSGLDAVAVRDLIGDPRDPNVLYAGVYNPRQWSVFVTRDGGQRWESLGLPPVESMNDDTWSLALAVLDSTRAILYAGTAGSGILSTELGPDPGEYPEAQWRAWSGVYNVHIVTVPSWDLQVAYAIADGRTLIKTDDGGLGWTKIGSIPGTAQVSELATGNVPGTLYVSTRGDGVLRTIDEGKTWAPINEGLQDPNVVALATKSDNHGDLLYVVTEAGVVYRRPGTGSRWEDIRENLDVITPRLLVVHKSGTPELILTGDSGVYSYTRNKLLGFEIP